MDTRNLNLSIFFLSSTAFGLLVFLSPVVSALLLGLQLQIVFAAPLLGLALSSSLYLATQEKTGAGVRTWKSSPLIWALFFALSVLILFIGLTLIQRSMDQDMLSRIISPSEKTIETLSLSQPFSLRFLTFVLMALPFFFYGWFLFAALKLQKATFLFRYEMLGAGVGSISACLFLEQMGFISTLLLLLFGAGVALFLLSSKRSSRGLVVLGVFSLGSLILFSPQWFRPERNLHLVARDFQLKDRSLLKIKEDWTTYAKMTTLERGLGDHRRRVVALGDGTGLAEIPLANTQPRHLVLINLITLLKPQAQNVTVLFAGGGTELVQLSRFYGPTTKVTGVEMNPKIVADAQDSQDSDLKNFSSPPTQLLVREARKYLDEPGPNQDVLLYSWSGATVAHYSGAIAHTTQYSFTYEAIRSAIRKLSPAGLLIIAGGSKINLMIILRKLEQEGVINSPLRDSILVLGDPEKTDQDFSKLWDDKILVFKNGSFSAAELQELNSKLPEKHEILNSKLIDEVLNSNLNSDFFKKFQAATGVPFQLHTDNNPFVYDSVTFEGHEFSLIAGLIAVGFLISLFSTRQGHQIYLKPLAYLCGAIGAVLQILILFRFQIFIENSTAWLLAIICGPFFGSYLGSRMSEILPLRIFLTLTLIALFMLLLFFQHLPFLALVGLTAAVWILWGSVFPLILRWTQATGDELHFWSLDLWGSLFGSLLVPSLLRKFGFGAVQFGLILASLLIGWLLMKRSWSRP